MAPGGSTTGRKASAACATSGTCALSTCALMHACMAGGPATGIGSHRGVLVALPDEEAAIVVQQLQRACRVAPQLRVGSAPGIDLLENFLRCQREGFRSAGEAGAAGTTKGWAVAAPSLREGKPRARQLSSSRSHVLVISDAE